MAVYVLKNKRRTLEIVPNVGSAFASRNPKAAPSTSLDSLTFYHTGKGLYFANIVKF